MIVLSATDITVSFGTRVILSHVSFSLQENDRMGLVGVNGCGKSTLFRVLMGELTPDTGAVYLSSGKSIGILRQNDAFLEDQTGGYNGGDNALSFLLAGFPELLETEGKLLEMEEILHAGGGTAELNAAYDDLRRQFERAGGLEFRSRAAGILTRMGFDSEAMHRPLSTLSGGQRTRLALCRQLCREPDVLLLDEPTNHLDIETLGWLENFLSQYRGCVLEISHDRYFLDRVTNRTLALEYGAAKVYSGGYSATVEQRRIDRELTEKHYKDQQKEIARQEAYIAQQRAFNRERNIIAAESRLKLLAKMDKLERPREAPKAIRMRFGEAIASGSEVLEAKGLSMSFGTRTLFRDVNFLLKSGDRMFIVGPNGCGKSTLLKILLRRLAPTAGYVREGYNLQIGYYDQENQNLTPENTVFEELHNAYPNLTETEVRNTLALFRFIGDDVFRTVSVLSGGERARLTLAKLMLSKVNLLVLDEPTNHLDIDSREALESALAAFDGTVLAVSHDRYLIDKLATRILSLTPGGTGTLFPVSKPGEGYREYLTDRKSREAQNIPESRKPEEPVSENKAQYLARKEDAARARKEAARQERLKKEAEALEKELEKIQKELYGDAASDYKKAAELDARREEAEERLLEIYEEIGV